MIGPPHRSPRSSDSRPSRWFLFVWVSLVYVVGWLARGEIHLGSGTVAVVHGTGQVLTGNLAGTYHSAPWHPSVLFAAAMVTHYLLHTVVLVDRWPTRLLLAYFPVQAGLLALIAATDLDTGLVIGLALAVCGEAPIVLSSGRAVLFAVACCATGCVAAFAWRDPAAVVWNTTDYLSMILFVTGGTLLLLQQRQAHARQRILNAELAAASARIERLTRETEQRRIARELHDTLSQGLVGITMQLQAGIAHLEHRDHQALPILNGAVARAHTTLADARAAIHDLRLGTSAGCDGTDLRKALRSAIDRWRPILPCQVGLDLAPELDRADHPATQRTQELLPLVARVVEEALTNIARHAHPTQADVAVLVSPEEVTVRVSDDGVGFTPDQPATTPGYGLLGMTERARLAGCRLDIHSTPGTGTTLRLTIPLPPREASPPHTGRTTRP